MYTDKLHMTRVQNGIPQERRYCVPGSHSFWTVVTRGVKPNQCPKHRTAHPQYLAQ